MLFGGSTDETILNPNTFGKQVQVGNNFIIVHNTSKYPQREIIYRGQDYMQKVRASFEANCQVKVPIFDKQIGREAKVYTHLGFEDRRGTQDCARKSKRPTTWAQPSRVQSPTTIEPTLSQDPPQILSSTHVLSADGKMNTHSSISSQGSLTRDKNSSIPDQPSPILL